MMRSDRLTAPLLACGLLSSLLYLAADVFAAQRFPGYDYASQAISEMSAIGAPTADLLAPLYTSYSILFALFGAGVWLAAGERRSLRASSAFIIAVAALGIGWALFPMNVRGAERTLTDVMHLVMGAASSLFLLGAIICGAAVLGRGFRIYSAATVLVMLAFGYLMSMDVPRVATDLPTPYLGITERVMMGAWLLWMAMFSVSLLREHSDPAVRLRLPDGSR
jgi:hypothetical protein